MLRSVLFRRRLLRFLFWILRRNRIGSYHRPLLCLSILPAWGSFPWCVRRRLLLPTTFLLPWLPWVAAFRFCPTRCGASQLLPRSSSLPMSRPFRLGGCPYSYRRRSRVRRKRPSSIPCRSSFCALRSTRRKFRGVLLRCFLW